MTTGVIVARFQVPYLHIGHLHIVSTSLRENDETVIILGCTDKQDERNKYSILERRLMIQKIFPQIRIYTIYDRPSDVDWSDRVDRWCDLFNSPTLYHGRDSFKSHYTGKYPTKEVEEIPGCSGTTLRETLKTTSNGRL